MMITRSQRVNDREIYVVDGAFSKAGLEAIDRRMRAGPYTRSRSSRADTREYKFFAMNLRTADVMETYLGEAVRDAIKTCFPGERFVAKKFVSNMRLFGNSAFPHRDVSTAKKDITVLVYTNTKWEFDWGGETLFYDDSGECVMGVVPKPGRIALFRGAVVHRSGLVNRECYEARFTFAMTFAALPPEAPSPSAPNGVRAPARPPRSRPKVARPALARAAMR